MLPCRQVIATCTETHSSPKRCIRRHRGCRTSYHYRHRPIVGVLKTASIGQSDSLDLNHRQKLHCHRLHGNRLASRDTTPVYHSLTQMKTLRSNPNSKTFPRIKKLHRLDVETRLPKGSSGIQRASIRLFFTQNRDKAKRRRGRGLSPESSSTTGPSTQDRSTTRFLNHAVSENPGP
jgi:hypothetical protein